MGFGGAGQLPTCLGARGGGGEADHLLTWLDEGWGRGRGRSPTHLSTYLPVRGVERVGWGAFLSL